MQNEHYLVVGLGITGFSVVEYLSKQAVKVSVTDSRYTPPKLPDLADKFSQVKIMLGQITVPEDITTIVLSPGVAISDPGLQEAIAKGIPIIGDIELFARVVDKPVIAITGSNGKSTVTTLLGAMADASGIKAGVGGNLGTPALDLLDPKNECYILELSSFQLETTNSLHAKVVTILNVSPDHMDRYSDLLAYQQAKQRIYNHASYAVVNRADPLTAVSKNLKPITLSFGLDQPTLGNYGLMQHAGARWLAKGLTPLMPAQELAMIGEHNIANVLAALAMGEIAGFDLTAMLSTLRTFQGLEHRCEKVLSAQDIIWVNDSKGTNVAATVAALEGLAKAIHGKWIIILGGQGKNADFSPLIEPLQKYCRAAILIGDAADELYALLHSSTPCFRAQDLSEVIEIANQHATTGDGVLLSPACASLDMFENYAHRGKEFKQQVLRRIGKQYATEASTVSD